MFRQNEKAWGEKAERYCSGWCVAKRLKRVKSRNLDTCWQAIAIVKAKDGGGLDQGGRSMFDEK